MGISAREAAEQAGMSKAGIIKAIRTGKLSATKNIHGEWEIEPVELFRVYAPVPAEPLTNVNLQPKVDSELVDTQSAILQERVNNLERLLRDKDETISDLRQRLDSEADERRKLTLLLTDKQPPPAKRWWRFWDI